MLQIKGNLKAMITNAIPNTRIDTILEGEIGYK